MDRPIYGMTTDPSSGILGQIRAARRMGFDYFELGLEPPMGDHNLLLKSRKKILSELKRFSHPVVAHSPYWYELWSSYTGIREAWVSVVKETIDAAKAFGARNFNIHAPLPHGGYTNEKHWNAAIKTYIKSMKEIVSYAKTKDIVVMMENMGPFGADFGDYAMIMDAVPGLKAHIDIGHAYLEGAMKMVRAYLKVFRKDVVHFHFTDNLGLSDDHLGIGQGIIDYFKVMEILKKMDYTGTISLEVISTRDVLKDSLKIIKAIQEEVWPR